MITMLAMTAMLVGAMLGLRFSVLVLVPAIIACSAATIGMTHSNGPWSILLAMASAITALQMGYLGGTIIRWHNKSIRPFSPAGQHQQPETLSA